MTSGKVEEKNTMYEALDLMLKKAGYTITSFNVYNVNTKVLNFDISFETVQKDDK